MRLLIGILMILLCGCGGGDDPAEPEADSGPVQILSNSSVEDGSSSPTAWSNGTEGPQPGNDYVFRWSASEAQSGSRSLMIRLDAVADANAFAHWNQTIDTNIPHGKKLVLKATVKTDLSGGGAGFMVRADDDSGPVTWATTQGHVSITGVGDWRTESTTLATVPDGVTELWVFLMLFPNTTGTIYFDDIELTYD
jgi:hypothetical protein